MIKDVFLGEMEDNEIIVEMGGIKKILPILMVFYASNNCYMAIFDEEKDEIIILKVIEDENKDQYLQFIEDEKEWKYVCEVYYSIKDKMVKEDENEHRR